MPAEQQDRGGRASTDPLYRLLRSRGRAAIAAGAVSRSPDGSREGCVSAWDKRAATSSGNLVFDQPISAPRTCKGCMVDRVLLDTRVILLAVSNL